MGCETLFCHVKSKKDFKNLEVFLNSCGEAGKKAINTFHFQLLKNYFESSVLKKSEAINILRKTPDTITTEEILEYVKANPHSKATQLLNSSPSWLYSHKWSKDVMLEVESYPDIVREIKYQQLMQHIANKPDSRSAKIYEQLQKQPEKLSLKGKPR